MIFLIVVLLLKICAYSLMFIYDHNIRTYLGIFRTRAGITMCVCGCGRVGVGGRGVSGILRILGGFLVGCGADGRGMIGVILVSVWI